MRRLIQSLPNLEVLAIHTASAIIDVTNEETIQKWDVLLDIVKYVSGCNKLRWLRFDVMDQLSFIPFLKKFGVSNLPVQCSGTIFAGIVFDVKIMFSGSGSRLSTMRVTRRIVLTLLTK